jgi:prepilin-type processing-associated H-X9-DG protein
MKCPKCGTENPETSNYCQSCGLNLTVTDTAAAAIPVKTSGLAVAALILGILAFFTCGLTIIPALICGIIALVKISGSQGGLKGTGMAITGIALPVVVLPVMALLMAILMPALAQVRRLAERIECGTNLSAIGKAMVVYANDNNGMYPTPEKWCDLLIEHTDVMEKIFICQGAAEGPCNYAMNANVGELGVNSPPDVVLVFESQPGWNLSGGPELLTLDNHQQEGCNILFVDGHVEFVKPEGIPKLRWNTDEGP